MKSLGGGKRFARLGWLVVAEYDVGCCRGGRGAVGQGLGAE
jgi:hypothetical protein